MFIKPSTPLLLPRLLRSLLRDRGPLEQRLHTWRPTSSASIQQTLQEQKGSAASSPRKTKAAAAAAVDAGDLVAKDLRTMFAEIHQELEVGICTSTYMAASGGSELLEMSKYYFNGHGKAIRPVIAMTLGHAFNHHQDLGANPHVLETVVAQQRKVAIISEMIHTASLVHDDVLDHADTRRGEVSVNRRWDASRSVHCGDYILAVAAKVLAQLHNEKVLIVLAQVLADLVRGEFQQLQKKNDDSERFQLYLSKTFNKTASLIAYSCKANAILSQADADLVEAAFQYGRNIGIAFQLVDDLLDFESSSALLGKPAGADLRLGLATAPVLFATAQYPELEDMIGRRFEQPGDVEVAFDVVMRSDGLARTRDLARTHCIEAAAAIEGLKESSYKCALRTLTEKSLTRKK